MDAKFRAFRDLILDLWRDFGTLLDDSPERARQVLQLAQSRFSPCKLEVLEDILRRSAEGRASLDDMRQLVYLKPVRKDGAVTAPAFSLTCDFTHQLPEVRLRVALFRVHDVEGEHVLRAIAYRYEAPEARTKEEQSSSKHGYYHAQPSLRICNQALPTMPWMPTEHPAFPLDAQCPVSLVFAMLVSLYGAKRAIERMSRDPGGVWRGALKNTHWWGVYSRRE